MNSHSQIYCSTVCPLGHDAEEGEEESQHEHDPEVDIDPEDLPARPLPAEPDENSVGSRIPPAEQAATEVEVPAEPDENAVEIYPADLAEQAAAEVAEVKLALTRGGGSGQIMPLKF